MAENYRLSKNQKGPEGSRTYEFDRGVIPNKRRPSARKDLSASGVAEEQLRREKSPGSPQRRNNTEGKGVGRGDVSSYHLESRGGSERIERRYEVDVQIDSPRRSASRYYPTSANSRGYYVLNKKGKRVSAKTKAEAETIKKEREEEIRREREIRRAEINAIQNERSIRTVKAKSKKPFPVGMVVSIVVASALFMSIVFSSVLLNEKNMDLNDLQSTLFSLEEQAKTLQATLDNKNDLSYLEDEAVNNLGMVNTDKVARKYIYIQKDEKIELASDASDEAVTSSGVFEAIRNRIASFFSSIIYFFQ